MSTVTHIVRERSSTVAIEVRLHTTAVEHLSTAAVMEGWSTAVECLSTVAAEVILSRPTGSDKWSAADSGPAGSPAIEDIPACTACLVRSAAAGARLASRPTGRLGARSTIQAVYRNT